MYFGDIDLYMETSFSMPHALVLQSGETTQPIMLLMNQLYLKRSHRQFLQLKPPLSHLHNSDFC